jgi:hypothetical protein
MQQQANEPNWKNFTVQRSEWTAPDKKVFKVIELKFADDKQPYWFAYDYNHICKVEEETDLNLGEGMREVRAQHTRALVCAYLRTTFDSTLSDAGDLLTRNRGAVLKAMNEAMKMAGLVEEEDNLTVLMREAQEAVQRLLQYREAMKAAKIATDADPDALAAQIAEPVAA